MCSFWPKRRQWTEKTQEYNLLYSHSLHKVAILKWLSSDLNVYNVFPHFLLFFYRYILPASYRNFLCISTKLSVRMKISSSLFVHNQSNNFPASCYKFRSMFWKLRPFSGWCVSAVPGRNEIKIFESINDTRRQCWKKDPCKNLCKLGVKSTF